MTTLEQELRDLLGTRGASLVGFADLSAVPAAVRQELPRAVSIAVALAPAIVVPLVHGPTVPYHAEYVRVNRLLDDLGGAAVALLRRRGHRALTAAPATVRALPPDLATPLPHKLAATRSGLGWIGKSDLLVTAQYGPAVRLITVLTDAPLPCAAPVDESRCATCTDCVDACPAKAIRGAQWTVGTPRDALVEAPACRETALARAAAVGVDATICGICIGVCPYTHRWLRRIRSGKHAAGA